MCISREVSEPCRPIRVISYLKSTRAHQRPVVVGGHDDVAEAQAYAVVHGAEPAAGDRLVAGEHGGLVAEDRAPGGRHVLDRTAAAVDVPEPRLTAEQHHTVAQARLLVDVDVRLGGRVDHAVVGDDEQAHLVRERLAELLDVLVDVAQLGAPALRVDAGPVPVPVEVTVVDVGQRRTPTRARHRPVDALGEVVGADVLRSPLAAARQAGAGELALADHAGVHAGSLEPVEDGAVRLPLQGVDRLVPEQRVQQLPGLRDPRGEPHQPVLARRQRRPERGERGGRGRRHATGGGLLTQQRVEVRRLRAVLGQQLVAEPVDEHHDVRRGGRQHQRGLVEADPDTERGRDRRQHVAQRAAGSRARRSPLGPAAGPPQLWVRAERLSANASTSSTACCPSAAELTRREKSSEASTPV